jgi:hypothetical protein
VIYSLGLLVEEKLLRYEATWRDGVGCGRWTAPPVFFSIGAKVDRHRSTAYVRRRGIP